MASLESVLRGRVLRAGCKTRTLWRDATTGQGSTPSVDIPEGSMYVQGVQELELPAYVALARPRLRLHTGRGAAAETRGGHTIRLSGYLCENNQYSSKIEGACNTSTEVVDDVGSADPSGEHAESGGSAPPVAPLRLSRCPGQAVLFALLHRNDPVLAAAIWNKSVQNANTQLASLRRQEQSVLRGMGVRQLRHSLAHISALLDRCPLSALPEPPGAADPPGEPKPQGDRTPPLDQIQVDIGTDSKDIVIKLVSNSEVFDTSRSEITNKHALRGQVLSYTFDTNEKMVTMSNVPPPPLLLLDIPHPPENTGIENPDEHDHEVKNIPIIREFRQDYFTNEAEAYFGYNETSARTPPSAPLFLKLRGWGDDSVTIYEVVKRDDENNRPENITDTAWDLNPYVGTEKQDYVICVREFVNGVYNQTAIILLNEFHKALHNNTPMESVEFETDNFKEAHETMFRYVTEYQEHWKNSPIKRNSAVVQSSDDDLYAKMVSSKMMEIDSEPKKDQEKKP